MTPLRQRFIEDMQLRGLAPATQRSYTRYVADFAKYFNISPDRLDPEAVRQYQLYLLNERKLSPESVNGFVAAVQFLYTVTLELPWSKEYFPRVRVSEKLPVVLAQEEVGDFFRSIPSLKYRAALMLCYGAGLRISEAVSIRLGDIDSKRMLIRVEQGKGKKDRYARLAPRLLAVLRRYWRSTLPVTPSLRMAANRPSPRDWLFPSWRKGRHLTTGALRWPAAKPPRKRASRNASQPTPSATPSPHIFSKTEPIPASFRCCSATVRSTPRRAIPEFLR
jgi:integrase